MFSVVSVTWILSKFEKVLWALVWAVAKQARVWLLEGWYIEPQNSLYLLRKCWRLQYHVLSLPWLFPVPGINESCSTFKKHKNRNSNTVPYYLINKRQEGIKSVSSMNFKQKTNNTCKLKISFFSFTIY